MILSGKILFKGTDILTLTLPQLRDFRGREISMIFQEPSAALNLAACRQQMHELFEYHRAADRPAERIREILNRVGFPDPDRILNSILMKLSGGMLQRIMIAMAVVPATVAIHRRRAHNRARRHRSGPDMELLYEMQQAPARRSFDHS